jgi:hypothetical protein
MKQWIIDKYNKGQDRYILKDDRVNSALVNYANYIRLFKKEEYPEISLPLMTLHEFLFNHKWGFAKAFWGTEDCCGYCGGTLEEQLNEFICSKSLDGYCPIGYDYPMSTSKYIYHIQQMVLLENPLKYLEQFKDEH